jgi:hypothetical protein
MTRLDSTELLTYFRVCEVTRAVNTRMCVPLRTGIQVKITRDGVTIASG